MNKESRDKLIIELLELSDKTQDQKIKDIFGEFIKELRKEETIQSTHTNKRYKKDAM